MSDDRLRQLLSVTPDPEEVAERAGRARRRALARTEERPAPARWLWAAWVAPALAAVLLAAGVSAWRRAWRIEALAWTPPAPPIVSAALEAPAPPAAKRSPRRVRPMRQERLEVHFALSDGTRVLWTFDDKFSL